MKIIFSLILTILLAAPSLAENLVLVNGTIIDGTLKARAQGNVRVRDGKIADIGIFKPVSGEMLLDVKGLIVALGFIDLRSRSADAQPTDGTTSVLLGSDGSGPYAVESFMSPFDEKSPSLNILALVGHGTVRRQIMGTDYKRPATEEEIRRMGELIEYGMREGAFGLASAPGSDGPEFYGNTDESIALAKAVSGYGGIYITGLRDNDNAVDSIKEAIRIGQAAKVAVQVSIGAPAAAGKSAQMLAEIDKARTQGIDIAADLDSYDGGVRALLQHPWVMFAGAFPSVFGRYVRNEKILTLERAILKMTGLPASRIGLKERGVLRKGASADVVVFDPQSTGIKHVFVNGTIVLKNGQPTGEHAGLALR